jgi:hypothetical protein
VKKESVLVEKYERKRPFRIPGYMGKDKIKMDLT